MNRALLIALSIAGLLLTGCGERAQTATAAYKKSDTPAWKGAPDSPFMAQGWTPGDRDSWVRQMHARNQYQNENNRMQSAP